jgi:hypothetical protein
MPEPVLFSFKLLLLLFLSIEQKIEENTKILELGVRPSSCSSLESAARASPAQLQNQPQYQTEKRSSPVSEQPRQPARDRTGARKALLQWAQNATKE